MASTPATPLRTQPAPGGQRFWPRQSLREADFALILRGGRAFRGDSATLLVKHNTLAYPRLGLIVPKRGVALAARRNRLKRIVREWFRCNQAALAGRDWVVRIGDARDAVRRKADSRGAELHPPLAELDRAIGRELLKFKPGAK